MLNRSHNKYYALNNVITTTLREESVCESKVELRNVNHTSIKGHFAELKNVNEQFSFDFAEFKNVNAIRVFLF